MHKDLAQLRRDFMRRRSVRAGISRWDPSERLKNRSGFTREGMEKATGWYRSSLQHIVYLYARADRAVPDTESNYRLAQELVDKVNGAGYSIHAALAEFRRQKDTPETEPTRTIAGQRKALDTIAANVNSLLRMTRTVGSVSDRLTEQERAEWQTVLRKGNKELYRLLRNLNDPRKGE